MSTTDAHSASAVPDAYDTSLTPDELARDEGRRAVDGAILRMAHAAGAPVRERRIWEGSTLTTTDPEPLAGITFALMLTDAARHQLHRCIRQAREDGAGWRQIGAALRLQDVADESDGDLGGAAFEYAAGESAQRFDRLWVHWTCPSCRQMVTDYGPYNGHPDDCEHGHTGDCQRRTAAVAAHDARWADGD